MGPTGKSSTRSVRLISDRRRELATPLQYDQAPRIIRYKPPAPEVFVPALAAWPAALRRPAPPATLAPRPTLN